MKKPRSKPARPASPPDVLRCQCPCGAALRVPLGRVDGHGVCPRCARRLLLAGKKGPGGRLEVRPMVMDEGDQHSGATFMMDEFRIEDHFKEIPEAPSKISFGCPCGRRLAAPPRMVDKRGKCPHCGARLLLVGKTHPRTGKLEIHPLVLDDAGTGETMMLQA